MSTAATLQSAVILDALNLLHNPGSVLEIRIPEPVTGYPLSGYFDNPAAAAKAAAAHSGKAAAVYVTLNPVAGDLLARSANRVKTVGRKGATTTDKEITRRRWFPIDFDPVRPAGISSTDAERDAALAKARAVRNWLAVCGWPTPVFADSGNGAHLLYRVDLPNDDRTKTLFERAMKVLASRFDCPEGTPLAVKVDTGVFNASRIWKLYGTLAAKGDSTETRPHRVAGIVERPESPDIVPVALIESLAGPVPSPTKEVPRQSTGDFFGEVNARALMSLGWVATLFPGATSYRDGYRVSSKALGRDLEEDLSIQPNGIKDFGLHDQGDANGGRRTPIDLVIEHGRQPDAKAAAIWLCRQMGLAPESLGWRKADPPHERAPQPRIEPRANTAGPRDKDLFSDYGNVVKLLATLSGKLAYSPGMGWLLYSPDKGIWEPEPGAERVRNLALETLRATWGAVLAPLQSDADELKRRLKGLDSDDPEAAMAINRLKQASARQNKVTAWLRQCETAYRIRSTLEVAEGYFWTSPDSWDANPDILACNNGVLDLATGRLLPKSPDHWATKTTGTDYRPGAEHPAWDAVVALLKSEGDRYEFVHQICGSGLHGANPNERLVIFQGEGGSGKGTLLTAIHHALGDYVATVEVGSLLATDWRKQNKSAPREDLLKLRGARFVYPSIEPPKDSKLDDGSIKALTGNDAITARYPHAQSSITFKPVFKLVMQTNFPLRTEFDDPGMKRRVNVVPFNQKPERPDPTVKHALMHDPDARAAVLAWLFEGYRVWRGNNFALPISALAEQATADYWADMNPYEQFAADVGLKFGKLEQCPKPKLTGSLKAWKEESGRFDASPKGFPGWLKSKGCFERQLTGGGRLWCGVGFPDPKSPESPESPPDSGNKNLGNENSFSTFKFNGSSSYSGYSGYGGSGSSPSVDGNDREVF